MAFIHQFLVPGFENMEVQRFTGKNHQCQGKDGNEIRHGVMLQKFFRSYLPGAFAGIHFIIFGPIKNPAWLPCLL
jgi:hypothetical protein